MRRPQKSMVIEKILKVNSSDPKVDELRKKLAALKTQVQQETAQQPVTVQPQTGPRPAPSPVPQPTASAPIVAKPQTSPTATPAAKPTQEEEIARLQQLSLEEQKHLLERQNPEIRLKEERTLHLLASQIKELINLNNEAAKRVRDIESKHAQLEKSLEIAKDKEEEMLQKMNSIDSRLEKFMGLYELITNQYNPFADQSAPLRTGPPPPKLTEARSAPPMQAGQHTVKIEDNLNKTSATVEVSERDAKEALDRFKRVESLLSDLQKQEQSRPQPQVQAQTPQPVANELHMLLLGFEQRLRQHLDQTLQEKLHGGFAALEQSLQDELRDALRREIEALQHDDTQVQQTLTELQELLQASEGKNRGAIEEELGRLNHELEALRDEVKAIPQNLYFRVADGNILKNLTDFRRALHAMTPETYARHVSEGRNDFADWIERALGRPRMASAVRAARTWPELEAALQHPE